MAGETRWPLRLLRATLDFPTDDLHTIKQRSREWHALRAFRTTGSEAPLICGNLQHKSASEQQQEVLERKVAAVQALNRGDAVCTPATTSQQQAMAWGTAHEADGASAYAQAAARGLIENAQMCSRQGLSLPDLGPASSEETLLCGAMLQECGLQVCIALCVVALSARSLHQ